MGQKFQITSLERRNHDLVAPHLVNSRDLAPRRPARISNTARKEYVPPSNRYAKPGEPTYEASQYADRYDSAKTLAPESVKLNVADRKCALKAVIDQIKKLSIVPAALAVGSEHAHLLAKFGSLKIRPTAGVLKGEATKALRETGFSEDQIWGAECHMKSKKEGCEFQIALRYVANHINEGAVVFIWPEFIDFVNRR